VDLLHYALGLGSGGLIGFSLGLIGGGGSILAVPLLVYVVGVKTPHAAIGTSALVVAANALLGLLGHARAGTVKWRCGGMYATAGILGAFLGSSAGKAINGQSLLFLFALVMIVVGVLILRSRRDLGRADVVCHRENAPKVLSFGLGTGLFSGFFGIGGGFLIVPGLIAATGMPMLNAVGTSLVAVTAFGLTTAFNYALSGLVNWGVAAVIIAGGIAGSQIGARAAKRLSSTAGQLKTIFAFLIFAVAAYMIFRSLPFLL
jgi:uncharacterized membrane protein YfcA